MPNFGSEIKSSNIVENWLFHLASSGNDVYLAFSDVIDSNIFYHGVVSKRGLKIRESLDLASSKAKTSNITLTIPDFNYKGKRISELLLFSSDYFLNQVVIVYSKINNQTKVELGSFRLSNISLSGDNLNLNLTAHRPFDLISVPQTRTQTRNIFVPLVYGAYTPNNSKISSQDYCFGKELFPAVPLGTGSQASGLIHKSLSNADARPHIYEKSLDAFIPVTDSSNNYNDSSFTFDGANIIAEGSRIFRGFKCKPISVHPDNNWGTTPENAFDGTSDNTGSFASEIRTITTSTTTATDSLVLTCPEISGKITELEMVVHYSLQTTVSTDVIFNFSATLKNSTLGRSDTIVQRTTDGTTSARNSSTIDMTSSLENNQMPEKIIIDLVSAYVSGSGTCAVTAKVFDVRLFLKVNNDPTDDPVGAKKIIEDTKLYCGADGLTETYSGSSGAITEIHEAHRTLLTNFASLPTSDPSGWSNLDSDKDWKIRYWRSEPQSLISILEQLQYEGGFIYSPNRGYIHIRDSESADTTLSKFDLTNISLGHTPFTELVTKMNINYKKHPAENTYIKSVTSTNSTTRTNYNISTAENIKEVNLDAYVSPDVPSSPSSNPNDDFYSYYDNIFGSVKAVISANIINPKFFNDDDNSDLLGIGSKIKFEDKHPEKLFGKAFTDIIFIITDFSRSPGEITFTAREIA